MGNLKSLEDVSASALPAKVLVLLSKYAQALRKSSGLIIKLSSLSVFKHVHRTKEDANKAVLNVLYEELLEEVNKHLAMGTMYTNETKSLMQKRAKRVARSEMILRKPPIANSKESSDPLPVMQSCERETKLSAYSDYSY